MIRSSAPVCTHGCALIITETALQNIRAFIIFLFILDYKTYTVAVKRLETLDWIYVSHDPKKPFDLNASA